MLKAKAIELLGGSIASAAAKIDISYQAVKQWPEVLPDRIADRVLAAVARERFPKEFPGKDVALPPAEAKAA